MKFFKIPLNLPHAGTISFRIAHHLEPHLDPASKEHRRLVEIVQGLQALLLPYKVSDENPPPSEADRVREEGAKLGRELVEEIERLKLQGDRLGQCVRNLFECLELGEEGARISLRAGEKPDSAQRP